MNAPAAPLRNNSLVVAAVLLACAAVAACAIVAIAYMLGWVGQKEHPALAAATANPASANVASPGKAATPPTETPTVLLPGETLVEPATPSERPAPMFPKYGAPTPPPPAPPASAVDKPTGVPKSPYLPGAAARTAPVTAPAPPVTAPVDSPRPRALEPSRDERYAERYVEEVRPPRDETREPRGSRRFCANCAVVTAVSQYVDEWEVHLRFTDGSRRRIHYDRPPPVARGDRVFFENGRLFLE
jgi:hypothetical protein